MKVERFITEYANHVVGCVKNNEHTKKYYTLARLKADSIIKYREKGLITADEAIRSLNDKFLQEIIDQCKVGK